MYRKPELILHVIQRTVHTGRTRTQARAFSLPLCVLSGTSVRVITPSSSYHCLSPGPEALLPVRQSWSQARGLMPPCCSAWLSAPPHGRGHPARPQSAHLGSPPLVRRLGGGRRE